jgi:proteasome lid subunit RPN8/RPN11
MRNSADLLVAPGILEEVIKHAKAAYPREGCGLISGIRFIPITNIALSASEFEMNPAELVNTLRDFRNSGEQLVAIYHSHPHGPAEPSKLDTQRAHYPEVAHLIVSLADPGNPQVRAFRILDGEVLEIEVHAIV